MDDSVGKYGRYILVRMIKDDEARLFGRYDVKLIGGESVFELAEGRHELVESGKNASAAEWKRLLDERDRLLAAMEVMES